MMAGEVAMGAMVVSGGTSEVAMIGGSYGGGSGDGRGVSRKDGNRNTRYVRQSKVPVTSINQKYLELSNLSLNVAHEAPPC